MAAHSLSLLPVLPSSSYCRCRNSYSSASHAPGKLNSDILISSFVGAKLLIRPSTSRRNTSSRRSSIVATVSSSPFSSKPEFATLGKSPKWSARLIKAVSMGALEGIKLKYPHTGTESLLLGILVEGTSLAAKSLRESGLTLFNVREEAVKLLGKSSLFFTPEDVPLTKFAQRAIDWANNEKLNSGEAGEVTTSHLLLGIWSIKESAGYRIMSALGFDDDRAKELAKSMDTEYVSRIKEL